MTISEESFRAWEQDHIEFLTSREMGEWLRRRDINARRAVRPTGEWIKETMGYYCYFKCNNCNSYNSSVKTKYCPNCGAKMKGEADEEEA